MVYLFYVSCLRYTILAGNPRYLALSYGLKSLTDEGGEETRVLRENPDDEL